MTLEELNIKVRDWDSQGGAIAVATSKYTWILTQLYYHATREWRTYLPAEHPNYNSNYLERLSTWIGNVTDENDQRLLLEYALCISFFSHDDFVALYRTALNREVTRWITSQIGGNLLLGGEDFHNVVFAHIHNHTWFCPVTDSMDINEFYKVNHLKGIGHRPAFSTLQMLAEGGVNPDVALAENVRQYMNKGNHHRLQRLVLLEDVVGSGSQCLDAIRWAVANLAIPILFVPLILCPNGVDSLRSEEMRSNGRLTVSPVVELQRCDLLGPERQGIQGWPIAAKIEDLVMRYAYRASIGMDSFGYKGTGCSLATFANTPDNTPPIVHNKPLNGKWEPLFPRVYRA